jgi:hypothetical protein
MSCTLTSQLRTSTPTTSAFNYLNLCLPVLDGTADCVEPEIMRKHGSLTSDADTNEAAWEAARGATVGAAKVSVSQAVVYVYESLLVVAG